MSNRTWRIAFFYNLPFGGAKRAVYEFARRLSQRHELDIYKIAINTARYDFYRLQEVGDTVLHVEQFAKKIFAYDDPRLKFPPQFSRFAVETVRDLARYIDLSLYDRLSKEIADDMNKGGYDFAFVHPCAFTRAPLLIRYLKIPIVFYPAEPNRELYEMKTPRRRSLKEILLHSPVTEHLFRRKLERFDRECFEAADIVLCNSYYTRESLCRVYGISARVNYLGVDTELFKPLELPKEHCVLSVGRLGRDKGALFILESVALVPRPLRPKVIFCYTRGSESSELAIKNFAAKNDIDIELQHGANDEQIVEYYNRAKLTVYPPVMEPFGLVPLESMACGTPVVGIREAGIRETVLPCKTGILTDREPKLFAEAIKDLLENDELRESYGKNGAAYVRRDWTWERTINELEQYVEEQIFLRGR